MKYLFSSLVLAALLFSFPVFAQETQPGDACSTTGLVRDTGGSEQMPNRLLICNGTTWQTLSEQTTAGKTLIQIGNDTGSCTSAKNGRLRFNGTSTWEYCNGSAWVPFEQAGTGGCPAPASCTNVGDVCSDGSLFAGFLVYGGSSCEPLFVTDDNQCTSCKWAVTSGNDDINPDSYSDGLINHANRSGVLSDFPAFEICESNTYHGKSDWYLPSRNELDLLLRNRAAIDVNAAEAFHDETYVSSTEYSTSTNWSQEFDSASSLYGTQSSGSKVSVLQSYVRCVRRD